MRQVDWGRGWPLFLFLILVAMLFLLSESVGVLAPVREIFEELTLPLQSALYRTYQQVTFPAPALDQEQKIVSLTAQIAFLTEENEALRRLLGAPLPPDWKFLPARVVGLAEELVIDQGQVSGVTPGMAVVANEIYVGVVSWVTSQAARVRLPADNESKIPVAVLTETGLTTAKGLLVGEEGGARLTRVLQKEDLRQEYLVVTSGEAGYPAGLAIGRITAVAAEKREPYQEAEVQPLVTYGQLTIVSVVIGR